MSGKLDQSLDQIMHDGGKPAGGRRRPRPVRTAKSKAKAAIRAPTGGVQKNKPAAKAPAVASALTSKATGDSKIMVSNLPADVTETQIKDYFGKTIGHVKKVFLTYGPEGRSRGVAQIIFSGPQSGPEAAKKLDGVKVDNRAMKIEVILGARDAPAPAAPKGLADRMSQPKNAAKDKAKRQDKPKTNGATTAATNGAAKSNNPRNKKSGRAGRPKKKTAEELDAEMTDYFGGSAAASGTAQTAAATGGDTGMVDEVL